MPATRAHLGVIFLTVLIDLVGFGIIMPILPMYAQRFGAQGIGYGALVFVFSAMQFLATALLGRLSDRIGRRPILLTTMLVNAAGYVLFAFAPSYAVLFLARVISGFASGNISAAQAYVADITLPADRARGAGVGGEGAGLAVRRDRYDRRGGAGVSVRAHRATYRRARLARGGPVRDGGEHRCRAVRGDQSAAVRLDGAARLREQPVCARGVRAGVHLRRPHGAGHNPRRGAGVCGAGPQPRPAGRWMGVRRARPAEHRSEERRVGKGVGAR